MFIDKIILNNFRIYYKENELFFDKCTGRNISVISGNNGYGKTTLLTALLWCLYGKLIVEVDEKYRKEVYDMGGYKKFALSILNRQAKREGIKEYSVEIVLSDVLIPSIPSNEIIIKRTFSIDTKSDSLTIIIDGIPNELAKEVGPEIFINDFILPKEISKFFFFDAEKIVSLAEIKTIEDKRNLSRAYSEVLGIKKYEDLKNNLEELRIRLKRNSAVDSDKLKVLALNSEIKKIKSHINLLELQISRLKEEKELKKHTSDLLQEKLIREGQFLSVGELQYLRKSKKDLQIKLESQKVKVRELMELAPFAIAADQLMTIKKQIEKEADSRSISLNYEQYKKYVNHSKSEIINYLKEKGIKKNISFEMSTEILKIMKSTFANRSKHEYDRIKVIHDFSEKDKNEFDALIGNLKNSYAYIFKQLTRDYKDNKNEYSSIMKKLSDAESKEEDVIIKEIRKQKIHIDNQIDEIDLSLSGLNQELGKYNHELSVKTKVESEIIKKIQIEESDKEKDIATQRIIDKLDKYLSLLKVDKKSSIEKRMLNELNRLMHKNNFIKKVIVDVNENIMDINLYDVNDDIILKETLSKGEQQLYATALLKALVDESNINFPVFIDSPLQKFDKAHAKNIICEFYPNLSDQVVIFPLLEKELTINEYEILKPKIQNCYLIKNNNKDSSYFIRKNIKELFMANEKEVDVY